MTRRELQAFLAWSSLPWLGEKTLLALLEHAREGRRSLADLWEAPVEDVAALVQLHPKSRAALETDPAERWQQAGAEAGAVESWGVDLLLAGEPDLPARLAARQRQWPYLFAYGALELLDEPCVALLNSRDVSNSGLIVTDALADALARRDVALVSSTNREAYQAAATAAKRQAGPAVLVLDRGLAAAFPGGVEREPVAPARVWDETFDPDLQLILSPFGWKEPWNPRSGKRRDALIIDLAEVLVAIDVRPGGTMERECLRAARAGKRVLALDRGPDTGAGAKALWEDPSVVRLPWKGSEDVANRVTEVLPGGPLQAREERAREGWMREVALFLGRACSRLSDRRAPEVGASPASGPVGAAARVWTRGDARAASGFDWLLADLTQSDSAPQKLLPLLSRLSSGGYLAAVVPAGWLDAPDYSRARDEWLRQAALRAAVRLPFSAGDAAGGPTAALFLQKDLESFRPALTFAPQQPRMGRFHLRRYLQEVLRELG